MRKLIIPVVFAILFSWTGCGGNSNSGSNSGGNNGRPPVLKSLKITSSAPSVAAGLTIQLTATGTYNDGTTKDLTTAVAWASSGTGSAVISSVGLLKYKDKEMIFNNGESGQFELDLFNEITSIQYGFKPDENGWLQYID
jgi:hypothetical protein